MDNLNEITNLMLSESRQEADEILSRARAEAEKIIGHGVSKGEEEQQVILKKYGKKANELERNTKLREKMEKQRSILSVRQELIDETVSKVRSDFENQTIEDWIQLIKELIVEGEKESDGEKPSIRIPYRHETDVKDALGQNYEVVASHISDGFILCFNKYDLNYEVERIFTYQKEEIELAVSRLLFDGDENEEN